MRVSPVALDSCGSCNFQPLINLLRPDEPTVFDVINGESIDKPNPTTFLFNSINNPNQSAYGPKDRITRNPEFVNLWLQYPNKIIRDLAMTIVHPSDSDDIKMEKIQRWVVENIDYMTDEEQYGYEELWVPPVMLLKTKKGIARTGHFLL